MDLAKSGTVEKDVLAQTYTVYFEEISNKFTMEHCWMIPREQPHWRPINFDQPNCKRGKVNVSRSFTWSGQEDYPNSEPSNVEVYEVLPIGQKATK